MEDDKLLYEVRNRPLLWDKFDKNHSNRDMISAAWDSIAKEMGGDVTVLNCRTRWTSMRDYFFRKHKEIMAWSSNPAARKKRKWHLYEKMQFLLPATSTGSTSTDLPDVNEDSDLSEGSDKEQSQISIPVSSFTLPLEETSASVSRVLPQHQNRKAKDTELSAYDRKTPKVLKEPQMQQMDENELFFKSLLPSLKNLDEVETMQFRIEVQQLILNYLQRARMSKCECVCSSM